MDPVGNFVTRPADKKYNYLPSPVDRPVDLYLTIFRAMMLLLYNRNNYNLNNYENERLKVLED